MTTYALREQAVVRRPYNDRSTFCRHRKEVCERGEVQGDVTSCCFIWRARVEKHSRSVLCFQLHQLPTGRLSADQSSQLLSLSVVDLYLLQEQELMSTLETPTVYGSAAMAAAPERRSEGKGLSRHNVMLTLSTLVCVGLLLLGISSLSSQGRDYLRPMLGYTNPTRLHYHVFVIRHAEMKYQPIHKCSPPQVPMLSAQIGYCKDWGDNRCGGDYLVEAGHVRTRCIVETVPFDGLSMM